MTDIRKVLEDVLARDAELSRSEAGNDCLCIFLSRTAEREYETGTCPHQRARQFLSTLASEQAGEEEIAEIIWNVSAKWLEKELSHVGLTPRPFSKADDRERRLHLDYARAILSRFSLREGVKNEWQPIEAAPKDGRRILIYGVILLYGCHAAADDQSEWNVGHWEVDCWRGDQGDDWIQNATHWAPLPSIPTDRKEG